MNNPHFTQFQLEQALFSKSLKDFIVASWPTLEPGKQFHDNWHIDAICEALEALSAGKIKRLLVNMPPRHMKSTIVSVAYPAWDWIMNPSRNFLCASYAQKLTTRDSLACRRLIQSDFYQKYFGHCFKLTSDQNQKTRFENDMRGERVSISVGSSTTGEGGDIILVDDPLNSLDRNSEAVIESTLDWWDSAMSTRLNDPQSGGIVVVMQRLHERDLTGHILENETGWEHLVLPGIYEKNHKYPMVSTIGIEDPRTEEGELLWPKRYNREEIDRLKRVLGALDFAGQIQQRPSPAEGNMFKEEWFRTFEITDGGEVVRYGERSCPVDMCTFFMICDLALTEKAGADYTVIGTIAKTPDNFMLVWDLLRGQWEAPKVKNKIIDTYKALDKCNFIGIEKAHYGIAMIQEMRGEYPIKELKPDRDKISRANNATIKFENGQVFIPKNAPWEDAYKDELKTFPNGKNDDMVDFTSYSALCLKNEFTKWETSDSVSKGVGGMFDKIMGH